jgi:hypothetical protein
MGVMGTSTTDKIRHLLDAVEDGECHEDVVRVGTTTIRPTRPDRGFEAHGPLVVPHRVGAAVVSKWRCRRPPDRHVLREDHPLVSDRLTFCMMVPYSSDNRCASALAISTRCNMHS